jgi:hypothetical protein
MRQIKVMIFTTVILFTMLACSIGGSTNEVAKLKSTIESLKNTIEPAIQSEIETAVPDNPLLTDNSTTGNANPQILKLLGQHGGSTGAIVVDGGIAYIGQGPRVVAVDISAADAPRVMGETKVLPGLVEGINLVGKTIFVVTKYGGLYSFDIKDPTNPKLLGEFMPERPGCDAIEIVAGKAYIACNAGGLLIADVSDPAKMNEIGHGTETGAMTSIKVIGNYAYIVNMTAHGLATYDVSDPANPIQTALFNVEDVKGEYPDLYSFLSVRQCGLLLCLADGISGLVLLNLDDPSKPGFAGRYDTGSASGLIQIDNWIYLVDDTEGVYVLDYSNPEAIKLMGKMPTSVGGWELSISELYERPVTAYAQRLYIADQTYGITIIDASDPGNIHRIGHYQAPAPDILFDITILGDYAYIIGNESGFRVLDVSDPLKITEVAYDDSRKNLNLQSPSGLVVDGHYAYISDSNYPFHIYDISNPSKPLQVGAVFDPTASNGAFDIAKAGNYVYLSGWGLKDAFYPGQGIWVIDVSDPNNPQAVKFVDMPNERWSLDIKGDVLYALDGNVDEKDPESLALRVFDISDPTNPVASGTYPVLIQPLSPTDLRVAGDSLYLSLSMQGIMGFDISDPLKPVEIGNLPGTNFTASPSLDWSDPYLIHGGMMLYDVSDTPTPELTSMANLPGAWAADAVDDKLYIVTEFQGLYVYQLK